MLGSLSSRPSFPTQSSFSPQHHRSVSVVGGPKLLLHGWSHPLNLTCARQRKITLNMGMRMRGWYDLYSLDKINDGEDVEGLKESMR